MGVGVLFLVRFMVAVRGAQVEMTPAGMCRDAICLSLSARLLYRLRTPPFLSSSLLLTIFPVTLSCLSYI